MNNPLLNDKGSYRWNLLMFIISYTISNLISGIIYDAYINYLQEVAIDVSTHFWSYYGYATFIAAILVLLVNRIGYKWTLLLCPISISLPLLGIFAFDSNGFYEILTLLVLVGLQLHYVLLAPFIANYSSGQSEDRWYSRAYWIGYCGWAATTFLGGFLSTLFFSLRGAISFRQAQELTRDVTSLSPSLKSSYLLGNRDVLVLTLILSILSFIPILLMREKKEDYVHTGKSEKILSHSLADYKNLFNKYSISFIVYLSLISFGMGLFTPYFTVFLNRNLFIDRSTASLLVSLSYGALIIFVILSPKLIKRFGRIKTMTSTVYLSIPFMLLIANGNKFGSWMVPLVGLALFMRSGLANLSSPIESAIGMEVVPRDLRPLMASVVNIVTGLISILAGKFTGEFLFKTQAGYQHAYYYASLLYILGSLLISLVFKNYEKKDGGENVQGD